MQITGRLELGDFTDEYGYTYNYRIVDATSQTVDLSKVSEDYALYEALAADGVIGDVNGMFDYLMFVCDWPEYQGTMVDDNGLTVPYYLYPGDAENALADEHTWAAQSAEGYFPGLIRRVEAVDKARLSDLTAILRDAAALEADARKALASGDCTYDESADQYALNDGQSFMNRFYEIYDRFSRWLTRYQL